VGLLPAGTTKADRLSKLEGKERTRYALGTAYHTALVMGLICAACLRPGRAPLVRIAGPRIEKSFLDRLLQVLERDQGHWQPELSALTDTEQNVLTPLLLDIAIAQKCRKHDYQGVSELLRVATQHGMAGSTLCGQAAQLLERLAACSHVIQTANAGAA
jgi:hypothetical protein